MSDSKRLARTASPAPRACSTPVIARQASRDTSHSDGRPKTCRPDSGPLLASPHVQASRAKAPSAQPNRPFIS